jgi:hypothetical protein
MLDKRPREHSSEEIKADQKLRDDYRVPNTEVEIAVRRGADEPSPYRDEAERLFGISYLNVWGSFGNALERGYGFGRVIDRANKAVSSEAANEAVSLAELLGPGSFLKAALERAAALKWTPKPTELAKVLLMRAVANSRMHDFDQAVRDAQAALALDPECASFLSSYGLILANELSAWKFPKFKIDDTPR